MYELKLIILKSKTSEDLGSQTGNKVRIVRIEGDFSHFDSRYDLNRVDDLGFIPSNVIQLDVWKPTLVCHYNELFLYQADEEVSFIIWSKCQCCNVSEIDICEWEVLSLCLSDGFVNVNGRSFTSFSES